MSSVPFKPYVASPAGPGCTVLRVAGGTNCRQLAVSILGVLEKEKRQPILEYIGAGACSQAVKAVAIVNTTLVRTKQLLLIAPVFVHRNLEGNNDVTANQLLLILEKLPE